MKDSLVIRPVNGFGLFRWTFFFVGVFLTIVWIFGNIRGEDGLPISDASRMFDVFIFFPCFWIFGFFPLRECERLTINRSGVDTINSFSKSIFHRQIISSEFVPADDVEHIELETDDESLEVNVFIAHKQPSGRSSRICIPRYGDEENAMKWATKAARILNCKVKGLQASEPVQTV